MILIRVQRVVLKTDCYKNVKINAKSLSGIMIFIFNLIHIINIYIFPENRKLIPKYGKIEKDKIIIV